jgi:hypothetical protein
VFAEQLPAGPGWYAHYEHRRVDAPGWIALDVRAAMWAHQDDWLDRIDDWHRRLSALAASRTRWWWLLPASRMTAWYPFDLKPLFFALGIFELCQEAPGPTVYLLRCPTAVRAHLEDWQQAGGYCLQFKARVVADRRAAWHQRPLMAVARKFARLVGRRLLAGLPRAELPPVETIVVSETLSATTLEHTGDHFFGAMLDEPAFQSRSVWFYQLSRFTERHRVRSIVAALGRRATFDVEWSRLTDVPFVLRECLAVQRALRPLAESLPSLMFGPLQARSFVREFWQYALLTAWPVAELAMYRSFQRLVDAVHPAVLWYAYEEKPIERAMLAVCAGARSPVLTVAFAHAAYSTGHRYLRRTPGEGPARPDLVAATGPATAKWLIRWAGVPGASVRVVGSPRASCVAPAGVLNGTGGLVRVVLLVGPGSEIGSMANLVEDDPDLFQDCELTIRQHPYAWRTEQKEGLDRLRALGVRLSQGSGNLASDVAAARITLFSATSAGLEAMLAGRVSIRVALGDFFDADPILGKIPDAGEALPRCSSAAELRTTITRIAALDEEAYGTLAARQRELAQRIYTLPVAEALAAIRGASADSDASRTIAK